MKPENDGLEDDDPFQIGWVFRFHVNLPGCSIGKFSEKKNQALRVHLKTTLSPWTAA